MIRVVSAVGAGLVTLALTACNRTPSAPDYWCEHDDSDVRVANSYCETGNPDYEWEPDGDDWVESHRHTTKKTPTQVPPYLAPTNVKPTVKPTTSKKPWYRPADKTQSVKKTTTRRTT